MDNSFKDAAQTLATTQRMQMINLERQLQIILFDQVKNLNLL
jgi:hypothetical protein